MKTAEAIYDEMADQFAQETGMELAGAGEMAVRLRALAAQVYGLYLESAWTRKQCFPQTATGEDLDRHAFLRGVTRLPASRAAGTLRFSVQTAGTADLPIPQGTVCLTAGLVAFATTQEGVLAAGQTQVDLPAQAVEPGPGGNVPAGTVQTMSVAPVGIAACTNPAPFTGGRAAEGDEALREYTRRFDGADLERFEVTAEELRAAWDCVDGNFRETLRQAADNIRHFHEAQVHRDFCLTDRPGVVLGQRYTPVERVGICVPGSPVAFPSTILMNVIPARIAGVKEIAVVTPPNQNGAISAEALAAVKIAGADRVFKIGGAQAVAALAYGTETVPQVDKIVGPGGVFVAAAKRKVFGQVDIDMIAGPSEILVVADGKSDPAWVAADLLSQAEHDAHAAAVLVTDSRPLAEAVQNEVERQLTDLPRRDIAQKSLEANGKILVTKDLAAAVEAANRIAPEHLELCVDDPFALLPLVKNAGSVFLGRHTPEALGDYFAGPNHTLPTSGTARFSSPLSVDDFVKKTQFIYYTREALADAAPRIADFAEREGLHGHARSALSRTEEKGE